MQIRRRALRQRCAVVLRELGLPAAFDLGALCAALSRSRGRPLHLLAIPDLHDVCGLWIATDSADIIAFEKHTSAPHQDHIVLHEIGHVLCDHFPPTLDAAEQAQFLLPRLDPSLIRRVLGRTGYSSVEEREAEYLGSLLGQRVRPAERDPSADSRLRTALEGGARDG
ncbi:regulator component [Streptomyces sp. LRE541]|uniref:regulator component n=1 Tax=Streptomyces sp. LRE541 TaxID=2931983 RepID=UPI00200E113B|nr:regulator component [Streptomyces sp. LRE541]UPZ26394.1 regulator component [Streptomyces sp. LRE541]